MSRIEEEVTGFPMSGDHTGVISLRHAAGNALWQWR